MHYGSDLARIHHEHFGMVARAAGRELVARLAAAKISSGTVVDLAAGTGILSRAVLEAAFDVLAVDISDDMLEIARREAPDARFIHGSLWEIEVPRCVAVTAVGEAMSYATDPAAERAPAFEERIAAIGDAIEPGGVFLFDIAAPGRSGPTGTRRAFWTTGEAHLGVEEWEDRDAHRLTRHITLFVPEAGLFRRVAETHVLRLYTPDSLERALERAGFAFERLLRYDDFVFPGGWLAYAATRRPRPRQRSREPRAHAILRRSSSPSCSEEKTGSRKISPLDVACSCS